MSDNFPPAREHDQAPGDAGSDSSRDTWLVPSYEESYHRARHATLINSPIYYDLKAYEARETLFRDIRPTDEVFEFGVGLGKNIYLLQRKCGYDISRFAKAFCESRGVPVYADLSLVPQRHFDVVLTSHVLEHLNEPLDNLKLLRTKLKPGGTLVIVLPVEKHGRVPFAMDLNQHLYAWNFRTINNLVQRAGYEVIENRYRYAAAQYKLRIIGRFSLRAHYLLTRFIGWLFRRRDMIVVAKAPLSDS